MKDRYRYHLVDPDPEAASDGSREIPEPMV
jgi:hypothetical protein